MSFTEHVWGELSLAGELREWFDLAISRIDGATPPEVAGRLWLGRCGWLAPGGSQALDASRRAAALFRAAGGPIELGRALWRQAWQHVATGNVVAAAAPFLQEAEEVLRGSRGNKALVSWLRVRAMARLRVGQAGGGPRRPGGSAVHRAAPPQPAGCGPDPGQHRRASFRGGPDRGSDRGRAGGPGLASAGAGPIRLGAAYRRRPGLLSPRGGGDIVGARPIVAERLAAARIMGLRHEVATNLESLGLIAAVEGNLAMAGRLFGHVRSCHARRGTLRGVGPQAVHDRLAEMPRQHLEPGELERLAAQGAGLGEEEMMAEVSPVPWRP